MEMGLSRKKAKRIRKSIWRSQCPKKTHGSVKYVKTRDKKRKDKNK
jgi:hypothetical protein